MKQKHFNLILFGLTLLLGIGVFTLKYYVLEKEKNLKQIYREINQNERELHGLQTDWAALTDPAELRRQAHQTEAQPLRANQIIHSDQLQERPAALPQKKPNFKEGVGE